MHLKTSRPAQAYSTWEKRVNPLHKLPAADSLLGSTPLQWEAWNEGREKRWTCWSCEGDQEPAAAASPFQSLQEGAVLAPVMVE